MRSSTDRNGAKITRGSPGGFALPCSQYVGQVGRGVPPSRRLRCSEYVGQVGRGVRAILTVAIVAAASLSSGCGRRADQSVTVLFTCDTQGRLEQCGCFSGQYGGMARLYTKLTTEPSIAPLCFDVGDGIAGAADYQVIQYGYVLRAFEMMHYDALNLGHREVRLAAAELRKIGAESPVPVISANVVDATSGEPLVEPYRLLRRGKYTIGVVGVVDRAGVEESLGAGLAVGDMKLAISRVLPRIREADMRILLAFTDVAGLKDLAREFYEFDLVLGGNVKQPSQTMIRENRSAILYTTNEAKTLGIVHADLADKESARLRDFDIFLLHDKIPEFDEILGLSKEYRKEIRSVELAVDRLDGGDDNRLAGVEPVSTYVGSAACAECHAESYKIWKATGHSHAFASLERRDSEADPNCVGCHTVGFGTPSGYRRSFQGKKLVNVGCESCHGPGSEHVRQRQSGEKVLYRYRPLGEGDCRTCHFGEFSRPFDFDSFWPHIRHGKEPAAATGGEL